MNRLDTEHRTLVCFVLEPKLLLYSLNTAVCNVCIPLYALNTLYARPCIQRFHVVFIAYKHCIQGSSIQCIQCFPWSFSASSCFFNAAVLLPRPFVLMFVVGNTFFSFFFLTFIFPAACSVFSALRTVYVSILG